METRQAEACEYGDMRMLRGLILIIAVLLMTAAVALCPGGSALAQQSSGMGLCAGNPPASLSVSGTSSNQQLSTCGPTLIVYNIGSQEAFYALGAASSTVATTSANSIPGNSFVVLNVPQGAAGYYLAAITASSTTTLRFVQGFGH